MRMGTWAVVRSRRQTPTPSRLGSMTSSTTRSNGCSRASRSACSPSPTTSTWWPSAVSTRSSVAASRESSSTTRIRERSDQELYKRLRKRLIRTHAGAGCRKLAMSFVALMSPQPGTSPEGRRPDMANFVLLYSGGSAGIDRSRARKDHGAVGRPGSASSATRSLTLATHSAATRRTSRTAAQSTTAPSARRLPGIRS